jgi:hypothetical protein
VNVILVFSSCFGSSSGLVVPKVTTPRLCNSVTKSDFRIFTRRFTKSCVFSCYILETRRCVFSSITCRYGALMITICRV